MLKEVCINCQKTMKVHLVGAYAIEYKDKALTDPYKLWSCDLVQCPDCGITLATRWGQAPLKEAFEPDFQEYIDRLKDLKKTIIEFY